MIDHLPNTFGRDYVGSDQNISQWIINHIISVLFIIAYYCGSPFAAAEVAANPFLARVSGPLTDAVAVSLE